MPREEYQIPTSSAVPAGTSTSTASRGATHDGASSGRLDQRPIMTYLCGDCGGSVSLTKEAIVVCPHCAGRVLYKERTKRMVQFEAR